jgi:K+ transporter
VLPALVLNYLGQGARMLALTDQQAADRMPPTRPAALSWHKWPSEP